MPLSIAHPSTALPAEAGELGLWIGVAVLLGLCMLAYLLNAILTQGRRVERALEKLDGLHKLNSLVGKMVEGQEALELRRLEHVLLDIRDGQRRSEERLVALVETITSSREAQAARSAEGSSAPPGATSLSERIIARLLALGYERIELITPFEVLEQLVEGDGEIVLEARRNGALHKGRVHLRGGSISDVQMRSVYEIFP